MLGKWSCNMLILAKRVALNQSRLKLTIFFNFYIISSSFEKHLFRDEKRREYILSPFGSAAATAFFLKHSYSRLVTKKCGILFTGSHLFWKRSICKARITCFFCTVHVIALFNEQCKMMHCSWIVQENCTVHVKNSEQCNSLALFTCTAWIIIIIFFSVLSFFLLIVF